MENFKVGDYVKIITLGRYVHMCNPSNKGSILFHDKKLNQVYFAPSMCKYCGRKAKITDADVQYDTYHLDIDGGFYKWTSGMFEKVSDEQNAGTSFAINKGETHSKLTRQLNEEKYKIKNILSNIASIKYDLTFNTVLRPNMADVERRMELDSELENYRKMFNEKQEKIRLIKKKIKVLNRTKNSNNIE